jgi:hypothetical protein
MRTRAIFFLSGLIAIVFLTLTYRCGLDINYALGTLETAKLILPAKPMNL